MANESDIEYAVSKARESLAEYAKWMQGEVPHEEWTRVMGRMQTRLEYLVEKVTGEKTEKSFAAINAGAAFMRHAPVQKLYDDPARKEIDNLVVEIFNDADQLQQTITTMRTVKEVAELQYDLPDGWHANIVTKGNDNDD